MQMVYEFKCEWLHHILLYVIEDFFLKICILTSIKQPPVLKVTCFIRSHFFSPKDELLIQV